MPHHDDRIDELMFGTRRHQMPHANRTSASVSTDPMSHLGIWYLWVCSRRLVSARGTLMYREDGSSRHLLPSTTKHQFIKRSMPTPRQTTLVPTLFHHNPRARVTLTQVPGALLLQFWNTRSRSPPDTLRRRRVALVTSPGFAPLARQMHGPDVLGTPHLLGTCGPPDTSVLGCSYPNLIKEARVLSRIALLWNTEIGWKQGGHWPRSSLHVTYHSFPAHLCGTLFSCATLHPCANAYTRKWINKTSKRKGMCSNR